MSLRAAAAVGVFAAAALALGGCNGETVRSETSSVEERTARGDRIEADSGSQRVGYAIHRLASVPEDMAANLRASTTINVDAPQLKPAALDATIAAGEVARTAGGGQGIVVATAEPGATFSVNQWPGMPVAAQARNGWHHGAVKLGPGVHSVRIEKPHHFSVETQVLVRPGVYEVLAVRLAKAVMRTGIPVK